MPENHLNKWHVHFGAGKLGIGAVLPSLRVDIPLVVVQKARESGGDINWAKVEVHSRVLLCNSAETRIDEQIQLRTGPYHKWFKCVRLHWSQWDATKDMLPNTNDNPLLLIVDHFKQAAPFLKLASSISCSLASGQADFAELLSECEPNENGVPVLAFENTIDRSLKENGNWTISHVITDRICSSRESRDSSRCIRVQNEKYLSIIAAEANEWIFNPLLVGKGKPIQMVPEADLKFFALKKRALVNSLHELFAILCSTALSEGGLSTGGQYLPLVMAWFAKEHPDFHHSIELYKQLRALQLVWPLIVSDPNTKELAEAAKRFYGLLEPQQIYDAMLQEAQKVIDRFSKEPDEIRRIINPKNLVKKLRSYREHILEPIHFMWAHEQGIKCSPLYDKPNFTDLSGLEDVLTESFLVAMEKAMNASDEK